MHTTSVPGCCCVPGFFALLQARSRRAAPARAAQTRRPCRRQERTRGPAGRSQLSAALGPAARSEHRNRDRECRCRQRRRERWKECGRRRARRRTGQRPGHDVRAHPAHRPGCSVRRPCLPVLNLQTPRGRCPRGRQPRESVHPRQTTRRRSSGGRALRRFRRSRHRRLRSARRCGCGRRPELRSQETSCPRPFRPRKRPGPPRRAQGRVPSTARAIGSC